MTTDEELREIPVSDLRVSDIGGRIVAIDKSGNAFDGVLDTIRTTLWKYGKTPDEMVRTSLTLTATGSELVLSDLPPGFRVQVAAAIEAEKGQAGVSHG